MGANPTGLAVFQVHAIGRCVLADDQEFTDPGIDQPLGLAQHGVSRTRGQLAAHLRNDAEAAAVVAALRDFQIGVMARRQPDARSRDQVDLRIGRRRDRLVHRVQNLFVLVRPGDRQHRGMGLPDRLFLDAQASGDDDPAVLGNCLADGFQAFCLGAVQEPAGIDDDGLGPVIVGRDRVSPRPEAVSGCARYRPAPSGSPARPCRCAAPCPNWKREVLQCRV